MVGEERRFRAVIPHEVEDASGVLFDEDTVNQRPPLKKVEQDGCEFGRTGVMGMRMLFRVVMVMVVRG